MSRTLQDVKVGDRVWIGASWGGGDKGEIKTVKRLTRTQVILEGKHEQYNRYQRGKPSRYGAHEPTYYGIGMASGRLTGLATRAECEKWDAEQEQKRLAQEEAQLKRQADEAKEAELRALMPTKGSVNGPYRNTWGEWQVTFYATEDEVRRLAERVGDVFSEPPDLGDVSRVKNASVSSETQEIGQPAASQSICVSLIIAAPVDR